MERVDQVPNNNIPAEAVVRVVCPETKFYILSDGWTVRGDAFVDSE
jgi:hypothetical protein